ncbi:acyltransferase [Streptomyces sp. 769]|uniref:acyltransferase family protein n=1 Tax=Streptomyces sp. 769 TaxID=1262452 RepID=UPI00099C544B|nr:acyltransferase [Streptomyces sp. 769]
MAALVARIDAATPPERDRAVDALRGCAIAGVVLGHWLVTALVSSDGALHGASPLQHTPWLAPISWIFQTLAVFFFVGGHVAVKSYASARGRGTSYRQWLAARLARLFKPVIALLCTWTLIAGALLATGTTLGTVHTLTKLAVSPLWFLLVFAALTALTPLVSRMNALVPLAAVTVVDVSRFALDGPSGLGWINVIAGWLVPYCLGAAWARGQLAGRSRWALLIGSVLATAVLLIWGGYPVSMVGVPGAAVSNLNPPTLAAVAFGLAQCALALLLAEPLRRAMRRPAAWAAMALVNLSAMTVFLWHQTAMMAITTAGLLTSAALPGLHTPPDSPAWAVARLVWLPLFAAALVVCWAAVHPFEKTKRRENPTRRPMPLLPSPSPTLAQPAAALSPTTQ